MPPANQSSRYPLDLPAWQELKDHYRKSMKRADMRDMFKRDKGRVERFTLDAGDLHLDYSKNLINATTQKLLTRLAREAGVPAAIESMFAGDKINLTENRSVLHVALRSKMSDQVALNVDGVREIWGVLTQMENFVDGVHAGRIAGEGDKRFTDIVNIGIGGSDLGLVMATQALRPYWCKGLRFHSVSNVDGTQLADLRDEIDPATTLFVVCSKTFTTLETMTNAHTARAWVKEALGEAAVVRHFAAASTNHAAMDEFGINPAFRFGFWDWVGGRYSLWSAVGLSLAIMVGMENFRALLAGARRMDLHFRQAPMGDNMPIQMAMLAIWYNNFFGADTHAVLPYDNRLARFPAYLQQLQMESNGKRVSLNGYPAKVGTGQIIWGEAGSNAQHSFYQLLHQGTRLVPVDFLLPARSAADSCTHYELAIANCLAQSEALMEGRDSRIVRAALKAAGMSAKRATWLAKHKSYPGNRPSCVVAFPELSPEVLGQLVALYEHKVFVEGVVWGINSFDQFGVELGKSLADGLLDAVHSVDKYSGDNVSTRELLVHIGSLLSRRE